MWYIIIGIIIIAIIFSLLSALFSWIADTIGDLADLVGGKGILITIVVVLIVSYLAFSWEGIFSVVILGFIGYMVFCLLRKTGHFIGRTLDKHDDKARRTAIIKQETQKEKIIMNNDQALLEELNKNCYWLGCMNPQLWKEKLPNFVNKNYSTSFTTITNNFAKQLEKQHITQNNDWFEPFIIYMLKHPAGATITKMLSEVKCSQLEMTHCTPDRALIEQRLNEGTKDSSVDVPEICRKTFIKEINEYVFTPTEYLKKLYKDTDQDKSSHVKEIDMNELL